MSFDLPTLNSFFDAVDDYHDKSFRDDARFRIAVKSSSLKPFANDKSADEHEGGDPRSPDAPVRFAASEEDKEKPSEEEAGVIVKFSPRFTVSKDGDFTSKLKASCTGEAKLCSLYQRLIIDTAGTVIAKLTAEGRESEAGQKITGSAAVSINTVAPPTEDTLELGVEVGRPDGYCHGAVAKSAGGLGEGSLELGARLFNGVFGVNCSAPLQAGDFGRAMAIEVGLGFASDAWSVAAKLARDDKSWTNAQIAMQRADGDFLMTAKYELDLLNAAAASLDGGDDGLHGGDICLAVSKKCKMHLPKLVTPLFVKRSVIPVDAGVKASTTGGLCVRLATRWEHGVNFVGTAAWSDMNCAFNQGRMQVPSFGLSIKFES